MHVVNQLPGPMPEGLPQNMTEAIKVSPDLKILDSSDKEDITEDFNHSLLVESVLEEVLFAKAVPKNKFQTDLRTIRESPETLYSVRYLGTTEFLWKECSKA